MTAQPINDVTVKININGQGGPYHNGGSPTKVKYEWLAPQIGEFAYSDGTFSRDFSRSKNLMGIVFDIEGDSDSGTVYILGKEYTNNKEWASYLTLDGHKDGVTGEASEVKPFINTIKSIFSLGNQLIPTGLKNDYIPENRITINSAANILNLEYPEQNETYLYVNYVNTKILPILYNMGYSKNITDMGNNQYAITSIENLNKLCEELTKSNSFAASTVLHFNPAMVFPYYYSAYLYKPENIAGTPYENIQWYVPSYAEWAKIVYQCGYSNKFNNFTDSLHVFQEAQIISSNITSYYTNNVTTTPIFALAKTKMQVDFPESWKTVLDIPNSLTTTMHTSEGAAYSYVRCFDRWDGYNDKIYKGSWEAGEYTDNYLGQSKYDIWAYNKRKGGLPIAKFNYKNPQI